MFGSHNNYGGYNNNTYGNASYYPPPSNSNDPFWADKQQSRIIHRSQADPLIASDSLYGFPNDKNSDQTLDGSINNIEAGVSGLNINQPKYSDDFSAPSFASSLGSRKTTTWASIASQPAKSQPKLLKSKMAASGLTGSTSKHLPPSVTMDAMSWDSKNGPMSSTSSGGKSLPPPTVITSPSIPPPIAQSPNASIDELPSPVSIQTQQSQQPPSLPLQQQQLSPPLQRSVNQVHNKENSWTSNGNSSSSGSISNLNNSPRPQQPPASFSGSSAPQHVSGSGSSGNSNHNNNNHNNNVNNNINNNVNNKAHYFDRETNENYNAKYVNHRANDNNSYHPKSIDNHQYSSRNSAHSSGREIYDVAPASTASDDSATNSVLEKLGVENNYNPKEFDLAPRNARFFIIKSYSEDDVHRSIKYSIWCSTEHGNKRLDTAFRQQEDKGPIYLFYSVNRSGHFCGIAQMMSPVDYNATAGVWAQDKWKGQFQVKWIYVKDVPNDELRHITLENNDNKPVTNSRDTQEVPYEKGKKVLNIIHHFEHRTSIFDDFLHYEKKQEEELCQKKPESPPSPPPFPSAYSKMPPNSNFNSGMPRDNQMPYRGPNNFNNKQRSYPDARDYRDREYRNDFRNEHRNDVMYRPERNDFARNERIDRPGDFAPRERNIEHRNPEYRENHNRDNREYRDYREPRDQYRDFHPPPSRDYPRERNDYRPIERDSREYRERVDPRERNHHERHQSWRN